MTDSNIKELSGTGLNALNELRFMAMQRIMSKRPLPSPNIEELVAEPMTVEATVTTSDGTTLTRIVALSDRTPAGRIPEQVRDALNNDRLMRHAKLEKISIRITRK